MFIEFLPCVSVSSKYFMYIISVNHYMTYFSAFDIMTHNLHIGKLRHRDVKSAEAHSQYLVEMEFGCTYHAVGKSRKNTDTYRLVMFY